MPFKLRGLSGVTVYFCAALLGGGMLAGPAYFLISPVADTSIVRITSRCLLLAAFLLVPLLTRWCGVEGRAALGIRRPAVVLWQGLLLGFALGLLSFVPHAAALLATGVRVIPGEPAASLVTIVEVLTVATGTGLLVAAVEETLFRGVVFTAVRMSSTAPVAIMTSACLYALAHFLRPETSGVPADVDWHSGFGVIAAGFGRFLQPADLAGDFFALLAAGIALGLVRERVGHIGATIGIHAAWVAGIKLTRQLSDRDPESGPAWLAGDFDGVIGWLAAIWILLVTILLRSWLRHSPRA